MSSHCAWIMPCGSGEKQLSLTSEELFRASATGVSNWGLTVRLSVGILCLETPDEYFRGLPTVLQRQLRWVTPPHPGQCSICHWSMFSHSFPDLMKMHQADRNIFIYREAQKERQRLPVWKWRTHFSSSHYELLSCLFFQGLCNEFFTKTHFWLLFKNFHILKLIL